MARTAAGGALTENHRRLQLQVGAAATRDFLRVSPLWQGDEASFWRMVAALVPVVRTHRKMAATLAGSYFTGFRAIEDIPGRAIAKVEDDLDEDALRGTLFITGSEMTAKALDAGQAPQQAMQTALVRTAGTVSRFVFDGARTTLLDSIVQDNAAEGYSRVTSAKPCAFCAMLASRGPVYRTSFSASFRAHDHCACMIEPSYQDSEWPARSVALRDLWNEHAKNATDPLNAFRQVLSGQTG